MDGDLLGTMSVAVEWGDLGKTSWRFLNPYGERINGIGVWATDRGMLNLPADPVTGYVQTGARLYDPTVGRFLSVDPLLDPSQSQTLNGYSYTGGDPLNTHDASGLLPTMNTIDNTGTTAQLVKRGGRTSIINQPPRGSHSRSGASASPAGRGWRAPGLPRFTAPVLQPSGDPNPPPRPPRPGEASGLQPIDWSGLGRQVGGFLAGAAVTTLVIGGCGAAGVATLGVGSIACIAAAGGAGSLTTYAATCNTCNTRDAAISTASGAVLGTAGGKLAQLATARRATGSAVSVVSANQLDRQLAAREIAGGHAYAKHVVAQREFPEIRNQAEFAEVIERVLAEGERRALPNDRVAYWLDGVLVIRDPKHIDGGTAFRPREGYSYFERIN